MVIPIISQDPNYKTPTLTYIKRIVIDRIIELWRSFASTFHGQNSFRGGRLLGDRDMQSNLENVGIWRYVSPENTVTSFDNSEVIIKAAVIKGLFRNHITFFAVNKSKEEIIFYDSKGWTLADYKLQQVYENISNNFPLYTFVQNIQKEQYDTFNCGVYVIQRARLLLKNPNNTFEDLLDKNPFTYQNAMDYRNEDLTEFSS